MLQLVLAANLYKDWLVIMNSWRYRDLPSLLSTKIETGDFVVLKRQFNSHSPRP